MQEEFIIKYEGIVFNSFDKTENIKQLSHLLNNHLKEIHNALFSYHYSKRETVSKISVVPENIVFKTDLTGQVLVNYKIDFFSACADLYFDAPEKMKFDFIIDITKEEVLLIGEYFPEEEPHEI